YRAFLPRQAEALLIGANLRGVDVNQVPEIADQAAARLYARISALPDFDAIVDGACATLDKMLGLHNGKHDLIVHQSYTRLRQSREGFRRRKPARIHHDRSLGGEPGRVVPMNGGLLLLAKTGQIWPYQSADFGRLKESALFARQGRAAAQQLKHGPCPNQGLE